MYNFFGIKFAPLNIPLERRLQTLCVLYYVLEFIYMPGIFFSIFLAMLFSPFWMIPLFYSIFYYYDRGQERRGGRRVGWLRKLPVWKYFSDYFPFKLIKTNDLSADRNWIFGIHPHGVVSFSCFNTFGHDAGEFPKLFPGITPHLLTLDQQFRFPVHRDIIMSLGACSVSKESMNFLLKKSPGGTALCLVVGGAAEALEAYPKQMVLTLNRRKGFIRIALENGASLVPVLQFGENECYDQKRTAEGSWLRRFQDKFFEKTGISFPIFVGRGIFQYNFGILPYRHPLHTVVGEPIYVDKVPNPTDHQINSLHSLYCDKLRSLYEEYNPKYGDPSVELVIT